MPRRANAKAGEPALRGHHDPLDKFSRHRRLNDTIARALCRDQETISVGRRIANCAHVLGVELYDQEDGHVDARLRAMRPCNARLCPFCEWRRTRAWRKRLFDGLAAYEAAGERRVPLFLTLTVPNPRMEDLKATLKEMNAAWHRMTSSKGFPTDLWFRRTEVTVGAQQAHSPITAHPHFHVLLLVKPSYFGKRYIKQSEWADRWSRAMRADQRLIVDIRRVKPAAAASDGSESGSPEPIDGKKNAVLEVAKYMAKGTQLVEIGSSLPEFHRQMAGVRLYAVSKGLRRYIKDGEVRGVEMMDQEETSIDSRLPDAHGIARWFDDQQEYLFTEIY